MSKIVAFGQALDCIDDLLAVWPHTVYGSDARAVPSELISVRCSSNGTDGVL